jgi:hypothetical protein
VVAEWFDDDAGECVCRSMTILCMELIPGVFEMLVGDITVFETFASQHLGHSPLILSPKTRV